MYQIFIIHSSVNGQPRLTLFPSSCEYECANVPVDWMWYPLGTLPGIVRQSHRIALAPAFKEMSRLLFKGLH